MRLGRRGRLASRSAPWAPVPIRPWPSGAPSHPEDAVASGSLHRRRGTVVRAGSWAKPWIAHRTSARPSRSFLTLRSPGRGAGTWHFGVCLAFQGGVVGGSERLREVSLPPGPARRQGWRLTFQGRTDCSPGRRAFRGRGQTPRPGTGEGPVTWSQVPEGQQPREQSGRGEADGELGSRASGQ